jgi:putative oxidoreductase
MRDAMSIEEHRVIRLPRAAVWALAILLAVVFVRAGISKLGGPSASGWAGRLAHWGYPPYARYVIGALEILGGLGVLIPRCRRAATAILVAVMIGALCTHAVYGEFPRLIPPLVLGGLAFLLMFVAPSARRTGSKSRD